jgi:hypothetical protein
MRTNDESTNWGSNFASIPKQGGIGDGRDQSGLPMGYKSAHDDLRGLVGRKPVLGKV